MSIWNKHFRRRNGKFTTQFVFLPPDPTSVSPPSLLAYLLKSVTFWVPDVTFPELVPSMPCGVKPDCKALCKAASHSRNARHVVGFDSIELLVQGRYKCSSCAQEFSAASDVAMAKLPACVREAFPFVLREASAITKRYAL